jgi:glutathione S-transferase
MDRLTVVTFSAGWGLASKGPFALKLLKWLDLAGVPYRQTFEDKAGKGPKGKNPWIELDGRAIGDTEIIIELLARQSNFDIDAGLDARERGRSHTVRRMLEEHFHQVLEWELFVHPEGAESVRQTVRQMAPALVADLIASRYCAHFARQLKARGIARHDDATIAKKGREDLDAFEALLGDGSYLLGDRISMADVSAYGLLSPMARWPMRTPVADDLKGRAVLMAYLDRMQALRADIPGAA